MPSLTVQEMRTHECIQQACNSLNNQGLSKREKVALQFLSADKASGITNEDFEYAFVCADAFLRVSKKTQQVKKG